VYQFAAALRIRPDYLEALESGRIGDLPGNAYALAFLRTYASALGLDPDETVRRFKAEAASVDTKAELVFPVPMPQRGVPAGAVVLLGVVLAVGAYAGWYRLSGEGRLPAETNTQVPMRFASLVEKAPRPPPIAPPAPPPVVTAPVQQAEAPPVPAVSPTSAAAAAVTAAPTTPHDAVRIVLRANADAWLQVRDRGGPVLLNRTLHPGETWEVPSRPNLLLTTGNAGGTDIVLDGVTIPPLGGSGAVRRDLPLDPDLIRDGKLAAANLRPGPQ
jgi:cytoskeleton protein RodZ